MAVSSERLFRLSKALTRLLRHKAAEEELPLREDGFFEVEAIVRTREMRSHGARSAEILYAIQQDSKKRYTLRHFDGVPWVRAAQGHSQAVRKDLVMRRLRRRELPPYLYHGTRSRNCRSILRGGLLAGGPSGCRTDIHLVEHLPDSGQRVLSGWRSNCELAIQVDSRRADAGGCTFYVSDNDVYLTEGADGAISPAFISAVVILATGEVITSPTAGTAPSGEAVEAGLRRARRGYMCVICTALACSGRCSFAVFFPCCFPQAGTGLFKWSTRHPAGAASVPCQALRPTARQPMDWPAGPLRVASVSTHALPAAVRASTFYPCHFLPGRFASNLESAVHWWQLRGASRTTAPLGAVSSHMSYTPNSEVSLLWSPGDDESEDFPPPPTPTAPSGSAEPARGTPLWSPGDDESEDFPPPPAPSAPNVSATPSPRTSRHRRRRLHPMCRPRPLERLLLGAPPLEAC